MTNSAFENHSDLGYECQLHGRLDEAIACYRMALDLKPDSPSAYNSLGTALAQQGLLEEAVQCFRKALGFAADYSDAYTNLGTALQLQGLPEEAITCFRMALDARPDSADAHNNLGSLFGKQGRSAEEVACYRRAIDLKPNYPEAHYNLGYSFQQQHRLDEAVVCYRRAIDLKPNDTMAHNNLGTTFQQQERLDDAIACYHRAIHLRPDWPEAHNNLGTALEQQALLEQAVASYRTAIGLKPDYPEAHSNLAMALLAQGNLAEGWEEFEWRWKIPEMTTACRNFAQPQWNGEPIGDRVILLHADQGYGDTLQFCRYVPLVAAGARTILEVHAPLARLLSRLPGITEIVTQGERLPSFDLHCPLMSLPRLVGTTLDTIPGSTRYLTADPGLVPQWRERLADLDGLRVGIVWAGSEKLGFPKLIVMDRRRSIALDTMAPLAEVAGASFVSLQKGGPAAQAANPPRGMVLHDFTADLRDFADTAALIDGLDLVISVDTAVAHLAGALGKPVWLLNRFDACWRWLQNRNDSPWYPTLRQFRQPSPGDWTSVIQAVRDALQCQGTGDRNQLPGPPA